MKKYKNYGTNIEEQAIEQMNNAMSLPIVEFGALMADSHFGYGVPIGAVVVTENYIVPGAIGFDICCGMKISILDMKVEDIDNRKDELKRAINENTRFGVGSHYEKPLNHPVMNDKAWLHPVFDYEKAKSQLGSSGSGNHFVEFGELEIKEPCLGLEPGNYVALLSHGGSRGSGHDVASYFTKLAKELHPELPDNLKDLAWLDLDSEEGQDYFSCMELMGKYAEACHQLIHQGILKALNVDALVSVENHHNYAWRETINGKDVLVHRKGATPAQKGVLGIIPGSMATPGFIVEGRGDAESMNSASHGAGRAMSRTAAKKAFTREEMDKFLKDNNVELMSGGLDECPGGYKNINTVMENQKDLVKILAKFSPRLVKMALDKKKKGKLF